ncbi:MAG: amidohydrolase [Saprospiraceae bacterium]|nr:amidohydrolase [Saprospiraceae bacterium]
MILSESKLFELRHILHELAEVSGQEEKTATFISQFLNNHNPSKLTEGVGGHGIIATYDYGPSGSTLVFRAELDALPIDESHLTLTYQSKIPGVSHKCGHDGHMSILLGLAAYLSQANYPGGKIVLLFQPAEETGTGASKILQDTRFIELHPDFVFALHNLPGYPLGKVLSKEGIFTAAVSSMIVRLQGVTSHASEPEKGKNPSLAISEIIQYAERLTYNHPASENFQLITPVFYRLGQKAYGISAGEGEMHFTLRAWTSKHLEDLILQFTKEIRKIEKRHQLIISINFLEEFSSTHNDKEAVEIIKKACQRVQTEYMTLDTPFKFGEDFGLFTQNYKGAMFGLGAGIEQPPLHHQNYDFPDELIITGMELFKNIIEQTFKSSH